MNYEASISNRKQTGKRAGITGIICNVALCLFKMLAAYFSGSMSIFADGLNNLSDAASSVITLAAFHLTEKPADKHHPYGHARFEYLASLTVSMLILVIGFELGISSVTEILHPTQVVFSPLTIWVLSGSIAVKLGLAAYNHRLGRAIRSQVLLATAADSRNDAITTSAVLIAGFVQSKTGLVVDGLMGLLVCGFILLNGVSMARQTVSSLLGEGADPLLQEQLTRHILAHPQVMGCHDLMVHDYGPGRRYASIHVEMDRNMDAIVCHDAIDALERSCLETLGVHLVAHLDPVANDPETQRLKTLVTTILHIRDPRLELHDFRVLPEEDVRCLVFDLVLPEELGQKKEELQDMLATAIHTLDPGKYRFQITFDL